MVMLQMDTAHHFGCVLPIMVTGPIPSTARQQGFFHQALQDRKLLAIPCIDYFDAHRLRAHLLQGSEIQLHPRTSNVTGPEGAGDAVEDYSSDEERDTTDAETDAEAEAEGSWCPPIPDTPDDPTESEIAGAADKLATMMRGSQPQVNIFFQPDNLGALPALWLQAKLTISLTSIQEKFAKLFMTIAAELWLRGRFDTLETVFQAKARNFTIRLAETSAKYLCSLMRHAETLATSERNAFSMPRIVFGLCARNKVGRRERKSMY